MEATPAPLHLPTRPRLRSCPVYPSSSASRSGGHGKCFTESRRSTCQHIALNRRCIASRKPTATWRMSSATSMMQAAENVSGPPVYWTANHTVPTPRSAHRYALTPPSPPSPPPDPAPPTPPQGELPKVIVANAHAVQFCLVDALRALAAHSRPHPVAVPCTSFMGCTPIQQ